jgi:FkbM family methyltransferase
MNLSRGVTWTDAIKLAGIHRSRLQEISPYSRALNRRVTIRPGTSDLGCFDKVFIHEEYKLPFEINPRLIVDAGANIGLASLYFANEFPQAKVIAVELESSNYELLVRNCQGMANVTPLHAAVWSKETSLRIANPGAEKWGFTVESCTNGASGVKALTIPNILAQSGHETIDILKLDVEGAELELFSDGCEEWLSRVKVIIIELHDRFRAGCSRTVYSKLCKMPFSQEIRGENVFILFNSNIDETSSSYTASEALEIAG